MLDNVVAPVRSGYAQTTTHIPEWFDEQGRRYTATADDAAYGIFELEGGITAQINSSWAVGVDRDELVEFQSTGQRRVRQRLQIQWELFLKRVAVGAPSHWDLLEGAKGVRLAELGPLSAGEGRRLEVPDLEI